jgi:type IV pilus assembly protein PilX
MSLKTGIAYQQMRLQKGLVLFFALIALVAMSLAAAALIRSVDTGVMVAGNLAFKQSATMSADGGLVAATTWLNNNGASLLTTNRANGYYATSTGLNLTKSEGQAWETVAPASYAAWTDATSLLATGSGFVNGVDPSGNTVRYVIQRMCRAEGEPTAESCLMGSALSEGYSMTDKTDDQLGAIIKGSLSPMYRVTARVSGPKNTISYIQAYVY